MRVFDVLKIDAEMRSPGATHIQKNSKTEMEKRYGADIFMIDQVGTTKKNEWCYELPTLASGKNATFLRTNEAFAKKFYANAPCQGIDFSNILIAGGAVSDTLNLQTRAFKDVDMFVHGLETPEQATARVEKLIIDLKDAYVAYLKRERDQKYAQVLERHATEFSRNSQYKVPEHEKKPPKISYRFEAIRNKNCITLIFGSDLSGAKSVVYQVIQRLYNSPSEVLHGFDVGSSAVGFDGENVLFTSLSRLSYEYSINVVDTTRRSTTYERRLDKYFTKGFDIVLPHLDQRRLNVVSAKYHLHAVCELPYLAFSYSSVKENKISIVKLYNSVTGRSFAEQSECDYQIDNMDSYRVFYVNLQNLVKLDCDEDAETGKISSSSLGMCDLYFKSHNPRTVMKAMPCVSKRQVIDFYDSLTKKIKASGTFNLHLVKSYIKNPEPIVKAFFEFGDRHDRFFQVLEQTIQAEKQRILNILADMSTSYVTQWRIMDPGTQLTSSYNPIVADPKDWYGPRYFVETPSPSLLENPNQTPKGDLTLEELKELKELKDDLDESFVSVNEESILFYDDKNKYIGPKDFGKPQKSKASSSSSSSPKDIKNKKRSYSESVGSDSSQEDNDSNDGSDDADY